MRIETGTIWISTAEALMVVFIGIVLIIGCASPFTNTGGMAVPVLPEAEEIEDYYNPNYAIGLQKTPLGSVIPEETEVGYAFGVPLISICPVGPKVAYASSKKGKWFITVGDKKGPEFESVSFPQFSPDGSIVAYPAMKDGKWFVIVGDKRGPEFDAVGLPVFSPDGSTVAYPAMKDGKWFVMIGSKKGPEFEGILPYVTFSPDARKVGYAVLQGGKGFIMVGDEKGPEFSEVTTPVFSPDGTKLAYAAKEGNKIFVVVDNKKGPEFEGHLYDLTFSPDGEKVAYIMAKEAEEFLVLLRMGDNDKLILDNTYRLTVSVHRAQPLTMATITGKGWSPAFSPDGSRIAYGIVGGAGLMRHLLGTYYYIGGIIGNSSIMMGEDAIANIGDIGLVTPLTFSSDGKEISWMVLKDKRLWLRKLKLR